MRARFHLLLTSDKKINRPKQKIAQKQPTVAQQATKSV
jgi:hypothetical protein